MVDITIFNGHFASTAQTMTTSVGDVNTLTQSGIQNGLTFFHFNGGAQRFQRELIAHDDS
jgi:hypothetical protein